MDKILQTLIAAGILGLTALLYSLFEIPLLSTMAKWPSSSMPSTILKVLFVVLGVLIASCVLLAWNLRKKTKPSMKEISEHVQKDIVKSLNDARTRINKEADDKLERKFP